MPALVLPSEGFWHSLCRMHTLGIRVVDCCHWQSIKMYGWVWEEMTSLKERKETGVSRTKNMQKEMACVHYKDLYLFMHKNKSHLVTLDIYYYFW